MSTITLSCLVVGETPYENAFNVKINKTEAVSELGDAIKEKNTQAFANVDAKDIKLWKDELGGVELLPLSKISKHFTSQPADEHIHIIVQRPVETKEVHCTATYGHGTEDEHIVINRESGKERIRLVDDEDLACIIWSQGFKVDLPIVLDTSQQPFSSWRFDKMKSLFGLKADDYNELPTFAGGVKETPEEIQNLVIGLSSV
ncbi:hypothetical protein RhiirB3_529879 [Rhizophagus irregularis]|nr:hypothetical protein RhiirB3_529879 [Rhizophagus irregularis]